MRRTGGYHNEALEALDMEYVLGDEGVDYKTVWGRSGRQLNVRCCPFCGNSKYKVYINSDTGLGNCFAGSCNQGTFNKWQFLRELYDLNPKDLQAKIEMMAQNQGWRPKETPVKFDPGPLEELPANRRVVDLPAMPRYLQGRGITASIADHFDLRYSDNGKFSVKGPDGKTVTQDYSNRIIIPIYNLEGELVSFQGRDATGTAEKRYMFPPMYSSTGSQLYNIHNWRKGMDAVVITEGPFDAIGVKKALDAYCWDRQVLATCSFGMSFSESSQQDDQINRLLELKEQGLKTVYLMWDNEGPAIKAAIEAARKILRYGFDVRVCKLKVSKDPGDAPIPEIYEAIVGAHRIESPLQAMLLERKLTQ